MTAHSTSAPQSLEKVSIFSKVAPDKLSTLGKRCAWRKYEPAQTIVDHLDTSTDVFFIVSGEARASIYSALGKAVTFTDIGPGDFFGEIAAIDGGSRSASIEARTPCTVACMPASVFWDVLQAEPTVARAVLRLLVERVRGLTVRVYEFSAFAVKNRIQAEVLRLAQLLPRRGEEVVIDPSPTHAEIASRVSTHREAVTRELNRLSRLGILEQRGRALVVKDLERLAEFVHEVTEE